MIDFVFRSWWFFWGSLLSAFISLVLLIDATGVPFFSAPANTTLSAFSNISTWAFLLISGVFYTLGSYAFVRAFSEPRIPPLFTWRVIETDELLGCWCNLIGTAPSIFYCLVYIFNEPNRSIYWAALGVSILFTCVMALFVYTTYGQDEETRKANEGQESIHLIRSLYKKIGLRNTRAIKHVANDWLAACWIFFWSALLWFIGSFAFLFTSADDKEAFVYGTSLADALFFTMGSAYFVAGSYPPENLAKKKKKNSNQSIDPVHTEVVNVLHNSLPQDSPTHDGIVAFAPSLDDAEGTTKGKKLRSQERHAPDDFDDYIL